MIETNWLREKTFFILLGFFCVGYGFGVYGANNNKIQCSILILINYVLTVLRYWLRPWDMHTQWWRYSYWLAPALTWQVDDVFFLFWTLATIAKIHIVLYLFLNWRRKQDV